MIGPRVLDADAEGEQLGLHRPDALQGLGGEDGTVVRQEGLGEPEAPSRIVERSHDVGRAHGDKDARGHTQPRVVVDHVQDLDGAPIREAPVRHVGLPGLVRERGDKAGVGALRALVGLRGDKAPRPENPPDARDRRHRLFEMCPLEVLSDRRRPGVKAVLGELFSDGDDLVLEGGGDPCRRTVRPARSRCDAGLAPELVAADQLVEPAPVHAVGTGQLGDRPSLLQVRLDQEPTDVHRRPPLLVSPMS